MLIETGRKRNSQVLCKLLTVPDWLFLLMCALALFYTSPYSTATCSISSNWTFTHPEYTLCLCIDLKQMFFLCATTWTQICCFRISSQMLVKFENAFDMKNMKTKCELSNMSSLQEAKFSTCFRTSKEGDLIFIPHRKSYLLCWFLPTTFCSNKLK